MSATVFDERPMAEINTTPLIDVMLVLLIIFMLTAPILAHRIRVDLPGPIIDKPVVTTVTHRLTIAANGALTLNDQAVELTQLNAQFRQWGRAAAADQAMLKLDGANNVPYARVAEILSLAQAADLRKVTFAGLN
jgi:biopolymer transport protein ExbD